MFAALLLSDACAKPQSERCKDVCQRETECAEERSKGDENFPYDLDECIAACVALERDSAGKPLVDKHYACAEMAGDDCEALMSCSTHRTAP